MGTGCCGISACRSHSHTPDSLAVAAGCSPRLIGLSATLADPCSARAFLAPDSVDSVQVILDTAAKREIKFGIKSFLSGPKEPKAESRRLSPEDALSVADTIHPGRPFEEVFPHIPPSRPGADKGEDELDEIANDIIKNFALSTNLIFGNSKQSIEVLADRLHERVRGEKWAVDPFVAWMA